MRRTKCTSYKCYFWSFNLDLNQEPTVPQTIALPIELLKQMYASNVKEHVVLNFL